MTATGSAPMFAQDRGQRPFPGARHRVRDPRRCPRVGTFVVVRKMVPGVCEPGAGPRGRAGRGIRVAWGRLLGGPIPVIPRQVDYAVTACFWSLLVTSMLRGLAASWTGIVRVSTPAA